MNGEIASAIGDLINGRKDVDGFVSYLDEKFAELTK